MSEQEQRIEKLERELADARMWQDKYHRSQKLWEEAAREYQERLAVIAEMARRPENQPEYLTNPLWHAAAKIAMDAIPEDG